MYHLPLSFFGRITFANLQGYVFCTVIKAGARYVSFWRNAKFKKDKSLFVNDLSFKSGVGGVRTLVQTTSFQAFYMLISRLVFD